MATEQIEDREEEQRKKLKEDAHVLSYTTSMFITKQLIRKQKSDIWIFRRIRQFSNQKDGAVGNNEKERS